MNFRRLLLLFVSIILLVSSTAIAQDELALEGSAVAIPVIEALTEADISSEVTGNNLAFINFCADEVDVITTTRQIDNAEASQCANSGIVYSEVLVAHSILTFVVNPEFTQTDCVALRDVTTIYAPSATDAVTSWSDVSSGYDDLFLMALVPPSDSLLYRQLDDTVLGDGFRRDAMAANDMVNEVTANPGALGILPLSLAQGNEDVRVLELSSNLNVGCRAATAENVENGFYSMVANLYLYVDQSVLSEDTITSFFTDVFSDDSTTVLEEAGFTLPSETIQLLNAEVAAGNLSGQLEYGDTANYFVAFDTAGQVNVAGSPAGTDVFERTITSMTNQYNQLTVNSNLLGIADGTTRLCEGTVDVVYTFDQELDLPDGCEVETTSIPFGTQATVMVANSNNDAAECLSLEQISTLWDVSSTDEVTDWSHVVDDSDDLELFMFGPSSSDVYADILLTQPDGTVGTVRRDLASADQDAFADPLYRAASVGVVDGGIAYLSWTDYEAVLEANQENIQLVQVDAGDGCVEPSLETINDGTYALTRHGYLITPLDSLGRLPTQALLWFLMSNSNYTNLQNAELMGTDANDLVELRKVVLEEFEVATQYVIDNTPEETPEPEATAEATESTSAGDE